MYKGKEKLTGKTVIVTGANAGIGYICAKDFAIREAKVIMVCRDMVKAEKMRSNIISETKNTNIILKHIDFASFESVRKCAAEIISEEERIDVLLNNAGAAGVGFEKTSDGLDILMQSNYFGPFLFTNLLLEKIKKSAPSRIVNVSSLGHRYGSLNLNEIKNPKKMNIDRLYCATKLGTVYFSNELALRLKGTGVTVNSLHPGVFPSEIGRHRSTMFQGFISAISIFSKTTEQGAQTSIYLCVSPAVANITGEYFEDCKLSKASKTARNMDVAKKLWDMTEDIVKLQPHEIYY